MTDFKEYSSPLNIKLIGPAVEQHRIPVDHLTLFAGQIQSAVQRIGRILSGQQRSLQRGRAPREVSESCALDIVGLSPGSLQICLDLHNVPAISNGELGVQAVDSLVEGVHQLGDSLPGSEYPYGWDKGVLIALRESGKLLSQGVDEILYCKGESGTRANYTREVHERVVQRIQSPAFNKCSFEGTLLMGDFKANKLTCRIHPRVGKPIRCTFGDEQREAVLAAMTCYVRVVGEAATYGHEIREFKIEDIEIVEFKSQTPSVLDSNDFFERKIDIGQLAEEQGVSMCYSFNNLLGNFWPDDESADDFLGSVASIQDKYSAG